MVSYVLRYSFIYKLGVRLLVLTSGGGPTITARFLYMDQSDVCIYSHVGDHSLYRMFSVPDSLLSVALFLRSPVLLAMMDTNTLWDKYCVRSMSFQIGKETKYQQGTVIQMVRKSQRFAVFCFRYRAYGIYMT